MTRFVVAPDAREQAENLREWLLSRIGFTEAERFTDAFEEALRGLVREQAEDLTRNMYKDEAASAHFGFVVYVQYFTTAKKRTRRSSSGLYRLFYAVPDEETLEILAVWHSAALTDWDTDTSEGT